MSYHGPTGAVLNAWTNSWIKNRPPTPSHAEEEVSHGTTCPEPPPSLPISSAPTARGAVAGAQHGAEGHAIRVARRAQPREELQGHGPARGAGVKGAGVDHGGPELKSSTFFQECLLLFKLVRAR